MGRIILKLKQTGLAVPELSVDYTSDGDALPFEHEEEHKKILEKLLQGRDQEPLLTDRVLPQQSSEVQEQKDPVAESKTRLTSGS